jgi:hypothetical protein
MQRLIAILCLMYLGIGQSSAQNSDFRVIEVTLADGHTARIVPLYQTFEAFIDLMWGSGSPAFQDCARAWTMLNTAFDVNVPASPRLQYMRRWRFTANEIDNAVIAVVEDTLQAAVGIFRCVWYLRRLIALQ